MLIRFNRHYFFVIAVLFLAKSSFAKETIINPEKNPERGWYFYETKKEMSLPLLKFQQPATTNSQNENKNYLENLGPSQVLSRGYSIAIDKKTNKIIRSSRMIKKGGRFYLRTSNGSLEAEKLSDATL